MLGPGFRRGLVWSTLAVVAAAFLAFRSPTSGSDPEAEALWTDDAPGAFARAEADGLPMVIDFYADWCGPCKQMERTTLRDRKVMAELAKFVAIKVNVDQRPELAERYGVRAIPTTVVADPSGKVIDQGVGMLDARAYLALLATARGEPSP